MVGTVTQVRLLSASRSVWKARQLSALKIELTKLVHIEMMQLARLLRHAEKRGIVRIDLVKLN
jgi:hypothetical protein